MADITPEHMRCALTISCPSVHRLDDSRLVITGRLVAHEFGGEADAFGAGLEEASIVVSPELLVNVFKEEPAC
jgi:hypothetical protein